MRVPYTLADSSDADYENMVSLRRVPAHDSRDNVEDLDRSLQPYGSTAGHNDLSHSDHLNYLDKQTW